MICTFVNEYVKNTDPCCCNSTNADLFVPDVATVPPSKYFGVCGTSGVSMMPECGVPGLPS